MCCVKLCCTWLLLCSADKVLYAVLDSWHLELHHAMQCSLLCDCLLMMLTKHTL